MASTIKELLGDSRRFLAVRSFAELRMYRRNIAPWAEPPRGRGPITQRAVQWRRCARHEACSPEQRRCADFRSTIRVEEIMSLGVCGACITNGLTDRKGQGYGKRLYASG
jgi:hypothetical protein